jgi:hypothetical protein
MAQSTANFRRHESPSLLFRLFGLFQPLVLAKSDARATAVLVDEFDAGTFQGLSQHNQRCTSRFGYTGFYLSNSHDTDPGLISEILLAPIKEAARCPALCRRDHRNNMRI